MSLIREKTEIFKRTKKGDIKRKRFLKRQMNKFIRLQSKNIDLDDIGFKTNRKPYKGWEY